MARWKYVVKLGRKFTDDDRPFEERRDAAVAALRAADLPADEGSYWLSDYADVEDLIDCLATSENIEMFDTHWTAFYDYADEAGVWVDVFSDEGGEAG